MAFEIVCRVIDKYGETILRHSNPIPIDEFQKELDRLRAKRK